MRTSTARSATAARCSCSKRSTGRSASNNAKSRGAASAPAAIAIATYLIASGIFTQSGLILGPAAASFHASAADTAILFSYLNAGNTAGVVVSFFAFPALTIRRMLLAASGIVLAGVAVICIARTLPVAFAAETAIGLGVGMGLSTGAVIIAKRFVERLRAVVFLATDCAFSAAGYVFPSIVGLALAAGWRWQSGYLLVCVIPAAIALLCLRVRFPDLAADRGSASPAATRSVPARIPYLRVALFGAALAMYLGGQNVFTIWAPAYLHAQWGLPAQRSGEIVGTFFGASSFGLIAAALLVTRLPPRAVLLGSLVLATTLTLLLSGAATPAAFFALTIGFGFCSTAMFKLLISIGSEQMPDSPARLVTFLIVCTDAGGIVAPALSAAVVKAFALHASLYLCAAAYATTLAIVVVAFLVERRAAAARPIPAA